MRGLNAAAFWLAVTGCALMAVWFSLQPIQFLLMALTARHVEWRGLLSIAPPAIAAIVIMFAAPAAVRQFRAGKVRAAWIWLLAAYALAVGFASPGQWLAWKLLADF